MDSPLNRRFARPGVGLHLSSMKWNIQIRLERENKTRGFKKIESTWIYKSHKASFCRMSASLTEQASKCAGCITVRILKESKGQVSTHSGPATFCFSLRQTFALNDFCFEPGLYKHFSMQSAFAQMQSAFEMCWFFPSRKIPNYFQNSDHQYRLSFALKILFVSFLNMAMRSKQNMRHLFNGSQHSSAWWIQDAHNPFQICTVTNLRCAPLSCPKRGDLVREPHNAARNRCDATCWLDHCCDQAHSAQR